MQRGSKEESGETAIGSSCARSHFLWETWEGVYDGAEAQFVFDLRYLIVYHMSCIVSYSLPHIMKGAEALLTLPIPVTRALRKLGHDIKDARRRRRIAMAIVAQRASVSKPTLIRVERGDPSVSVGSYATVLFVMGMADRLADLADVTNDPVGLQLEQEKLPKRIRGARKPKAMKGE